MKKTKTPTPQSSWSPAKRDDRISQENVLLKNQLARALADYDNLQKRTSEEKITWIKFATQKFIQSLLPVLDNFEAAQNHLKDAGLAIAISQLKDLLRQEGLTEISPKVGEEFDENTSEVIEAVPSENLSKEGKISELVLPGWRFIDGAVIRHAKIKVFKNN